jgi:catechol 2,3-dioxygenase-like lactoylglutathione lyase family enzyme
MEQRISLVTLGVADLARARAFYEALGWRGGQQPDAEVCFYQAGGMVFGLWSALGGHGSPGIELAYNVRAPEEVGAQLAEAERAGSTIVRPRWARRCSWHSPRNWTTPPAPSCGRAWSPSTQPSANTRPGPDGRSRCSC